MTARPGRAPGRTAGSGGRVRPTGGRHVRTGVGPAGLRWRIPPTRVRVAVAVVVTVVGVAALRGGDAPPEAVLGTTQADALRAPAAGEGRALPYAESDPLPGAAPGPALDDPAVPAPPAPLVRAPLVATGDLVPLAGDGTAVGAGPLRRYRIEVERGVPVATQEFADAVAGVLSDPRSWTAGGRHALQRVDGARTDAGFTLTLATAATTDALCAPLQTEGRYSCFDGERVVLNADRWLDGAQTYGPDLPGYRQYLVNHEVGHALGSGHAGCPAPGALAPVMLQQTIGLQGCAANPWPFPG